MQKNTTKILQIGTVTLLYVLSCRAVDDNNKLKNDYKNMSQVYV